MSTTNTPQPSCTGAGTTRAAQGLRPVRVADGTPREWAARSEVAHARRAAGFWAKQQAEKKIESFEPVMLAPHGGDLTGFFLIRGEQAKLDAIRASDEFVELEARSVLCIDRVGVITARINDGLQKAMTFWQKGIPAK